MKTKILLISALIMFCFSLLADSITPGRVLCAECTGCNLEEIIMVVTVMHNRIGDRNFGRLGTLQEVVNQKKAFSCIGDKRNTNWNGWWNLSSEERQWWEQMALSPNLLKYDDIVYYNDIRFSEPPFNWTHPCFKPVLKYTTKHFRFYSLELNKDYVVKKSNQGWKPKVNPTIGRRLNEATVKHSRRKKRRTTK